MALLELRDAGLYCAAGDFYVDPWRPIGRAVVTHAHSDHACPGCRAYLATRATVRLLEARLGEPGKIETLDYGQRISLGEVAVSFHPAGHILGSAQVRIEHSGEVWVVSGDFKLTRDPTCPPFEPLRCHTFVTESTFGLPIFRWPEPAAVIADVESWWLANRQAGKASVLFAYPLGKAQRLLASLNPALGPIYAHPAVERFNRLYREIGVALPATPPPGTEWRGGLILAPPACQGSDWVHQFPAASTAFASGWMRIRGTRRRRALDRGFVLSDHADWTELLRAIAEGRAESVWVTHGFRAPLARWLAEHGCQARAVEANFEGAREEAEGAE